MSSMGKPSGGSDDRLYGGTVGTAPEPESVLLPGHDVPLGRYTTVRRLLPQRQRRMVGAWCFVDHFGPEDVTGRPGMQVPPHPHTGLQTVTWLVEGEIVHRDSLGSDQAIRPGQLNLMSSGHGIAHSEMSPADHPPAMHGLQLWVALPEEARSGEPRFEHHAELPVLRDGDASLTVLVGRYGSGESPALVHTPLVAVEVVLPGPVTHRLDLEPAFEYGILTMSGTVAAAGATVTPGALLYLAPGRSEVTVEVPGEARVFLLGGLPFEEDLVMWWNFVGRSHEEIVQAREDWMAGRRFGRVGGCTHQPLPAPELPTVRLKARDRHGRTVR
jgi:redox-sensitive bicupin YhaK (pirin superfamily)